MSDLGGLFIIVPLQGAFVLWWIVPIPGALPRVTLWCPYGAGRDADCGFRISALVLWIWDLGVGIGGKMGQLMTFLYRLVFFARRAKRR